jgi:hypothetical protein
MMTTLIALLFGWWIPQDVVLDDVQYAGKPVGDPDYAQTVMDVMYPPGTGPRWLGHLEDRRTVVITVRGGNENKPLPAPANVNAPDAIELRSRGYVVVDISFSELVLGQEPYEWAIDDIARCIQYLRAHSLALNIDPDRIVMSGRSAGAYHVLAVALTEDRQDPLANHGVLRQSSRPNAVFARSAVTRLDCFSLSSQSLPSYFPGVHPVEVTPQEMDAASPTWWLLNPAAFQRTVTPYLGLAGELDVQSPCGSVISPHDGTFSVEMDQAIATFDQLGLGEPLLPQHVLVDISDLDNPQIATAVADWVDALPLP